jgi:hypothetical protein
MVMVTKVSKLPRILIKRDLSGNLVGNLTPRITGFSVWSRMVKEGLTRRAREAVLAVAPSTGCAGPPPPLRRGG